jgi:mRNA interferase MazF
MVYLTRHRPLGSTGRNGSGGDAGCSSPWRRPPRSSRPHARQRNPEDASLSRCVTDELNEHLRTVIVAPMTTAGRAYPWRVPCRFQRRSGFVALDQLRTVDAERLVRRLGRLEEQSVATVLQRLQEMFAE